MNAGYYYRCFCLFDKVLFGICQIQSNDFLQVLVSNEKEDKLLLQYREAFWSSLPVPTVANQESVTTGQDVLWSSHSREAPAAFQKHGASQDTGRVGSSSGFPHVTGTGKSFFSTVSFGEIGPLAWQSPLLWGGNEFKEIFFGRTEMWSRFAVDSQMFSRMTDGNNRRRQGGRTGGALLLLISHLFSQTWGALRKTEFWTGKKQWRYIRYRTCVTGEG